jgi:O-antigen ligase/polysaccharide polymerase Wzy-like membrane protein
MSTAAPMLSSQRMAWRDGIAWLLLLLSLPLHGRAPLGGSGRELGVSLFDAVFWAVFFWRWREGKIAFDRRVMLAAAIVVTMVLFHSLLSWWLRPLELASLLRETVKYAAFPVYVGAAAMMLGARGLPGPPPPLIALSAMLISLGVLIYVADGVPLVTLAFRHAALERGVYANIVAGLLVLTLYAAETNEWMRGRWFIAEVVALVAVVTALQLYNKGMMVVTASIAVLPLAARWLRRYPRAGAILALASSLVLSAAVTLLAFDVLHLGIDYEGTFAASAGVRHDLWLKAAHLIGASFPWGIGLGQFGAAPPPIIDPFGMPQLFAHNTPLAMIAELGALGAALAAALALAVFRAARAFPLLTAIAFLLYALETFLLNDGLGYRTAFLLLGLGLARAMEAPASSPDYS